MIASAGGRIHYAAVELSALGVRIEAIEPDLATHERVHKLLDGIAATGRPVDVGAITAEVGVSGSFIETGLSAE